MAYRFEEYPTVDLVSRASTIIVISLENENGRMLLTASNNQQKGYTDGGDKTASQYVSLSVTKPTIDANGDVRAVARMSAGADNMIMRESSKLSLGANTEDNLTANGPEVTADAGYYPAAVKKSVTTVERGVPTIGINRIDRKITARVSQAAGYVLSGAENSEVDIPSYLVDVEPITKSSDDLVVDGPTITTPAGFYPFDSSKEVVKTERAVPTIGINKITRKITARVSQSAGYVSEGTETATADIPSEFADVAGADSTPEQVVEGSKFVGKNGVVETGTLPRYDGHDLDSEIYDVHNGNAYIGTIVDKPSVVEDHVYSKMSMAEFGTVPPEYVVNGWEFTSVHGFREKGTMPIVLLATPTINATADDEESEIYINAYTQQDRGYTEGGTSPIADKIVKLKIEGNTAIMYVSSDPSQEIRRNVGVNIATCTVNVQFSIAPRNGFVGATTFADGTMSRFTSRQTAIGTITIPNVVCGSALFIDAGTYASLHGWSHGHQFNGGSTSFVLNVPSVAGTYTAEIGVLDD